MHHHDPRRQRGRCFPTSVHACPGIGTRPGILTRYHPGSAHGSGRCDHPAAELRLPVRDPRSLLCGRRRQTRRDRSQPDGELRMRKLLMASTALVLGIGSAEAQQTVNVPLGANIQSYINSNPAGTIFQLASGTYSGEQFEPQSNDQFIGAANGGTILNGNGLTSCMTCNNGATGVVFSNLTTTNYQTPAQQAPIQTGSGWQILNVTSTNNGGAGLYVGGPNTLVQGGNFSDNGQIGIDG